MSFLAGSILGKLDLDTGGYTGGFLKAEAITRTFPGIVTSFLANPLLGFLELSKDVMEGVAHAIEGGFELVKDSFDRSFENADKLNDMATNAGVAVDALSGLGLVASQAGSSVDAVADAFKFLGKNSAEAASGSKDAQALFDGLGVSLVDAAGKARPLEDVMFSVADALAGIDSPAQRTQVAMGLLGRSGTDLLATLTQGSAAIKDQIRTFDSYGAVVHSSAAKSADAYGDLLGEFKIFRSGIENAIGEPLRDALTPLLERLLGWVKASSPVIVQFVKQLSVEIGKGLGEIAGVVAAHGPEIIAITSAVVTFAIQAGARIIDVIASTLQAVAQATSAISKVQDILSLATGVASFGKSIDVSAFADAGAKAAAAFHDKFDAGVNDLQQSVDKLSVGLGDTAAKSISSSSQGKPSVTINVQPLATNASTGEISAAVKKGLEQAQREAAARSAAAAKSIAVREGL